MFRHAALGSSCPSTPFRKAPAVTRKHPAPMGESLQLPPSVDRRAFELIAKSLRGLAFGHLTVIVHGGQVVQIERTEKHRLQDSAGGAGESPQNS